MGFGSVQMRLLYVMNLHAPYWEEKTRLVTFLYIGRGDTGFWVLSKCEVEDLWPSRFSFGDHLMSLRFWPGLETSTHHMCDNANSFTYASASSGKYWTVTFNIIAAFLICIHWRRGMNAFFFLDINVPLVADFGNTFTSRGWKGVGKMLL